MVQKLEIIAWLMRLKIDMFQDTKAYPVLYLQFDQVNGAYQNIFEDLDEIDMANMHITLERNLDDVILEIASGATSIEFNHHHSFKVSTHSVSVDELYLIVNFAKWHENGLYKRRNGCSTNFEELNGELQEAGQPYLEVDAAPSIYG